MRVVFTMLPVTAHLFPLTPLAWALQSQGHEVRVVTHAHPETVDAITAAGLTAVPLREEIDIGAAVAATADDERLEHIARTLGVDPGDTNRWQMVRHYLPALYAMYTAAGERAPDADGPPSAVDELTGFLRNWRPDLVLWDPLFTPSPVAARAAGVPHARFLWGLDQFGWVRGQYVEALRRTSPPGRDLMAEMIRPLLERYGDTFDEEVLLGQWSVDPTPPGMQLPVQGVTVPVRWVPYTGAAPLPDWLRERPARPRVAVTLGTSARALFAGNEEFTARLLALADGLDMEFVATLTAEQLAGVGDLPDNVRAVDYVPLTQLLPTCAAVIHHGGGGTISAAVAAGLPQLILPLEGSEYVDMARYVEDRKAGLVVEAGQATVEAMRARLHRVLTEPAFRGGAAALRADIAAQPAPADIVPRLEALIAAHRGTSAPHDPKDSS
ncbi:nucleotide disphospho-sugar-binding domain-containing protein [Streptomyces brasiliscabiei]|uniref:Nucleotide disphospho-sugar-binding domain-containing protein n=1 Tax=Streptomyces brasiliscabiei TaxID=2736302 RepID=A0ABU8GPL9_9ACTN